MCELVGENVRALSVAMSGKKKRAESVEAASSVVKKRAVTAKIVEKWKTDHDREPAGYVNVANIQDGRSQPRGQHELFCVYLLQSEDSRDAKFQPSIHRRYTKPTSI